MTRRSAQRGPTNRRRPLATALLALVSAAAAALTGELTLALGGWFPPQPRTYVGEHTDLEREHFLPDPQVGWRMRPYASFRWATDGVEVAYAADERGFRTGPGAEPAAEPLRIALVGDSFLWGFGVPYEATCGARLASALPDAAVDNYSMPGFGLDQIWRSLRHWALPERPDLVIAGLFLDGFNRSFHAYRHPEGFNKPTFVVSTGGRLERATAAHQPSWPLRLLERRSRLFTLARRADRARGRRYGAGRWWSLNEAILDAMRRDSAAAGVPLLFLHIPYRDPIPFPTLDAYMRRHGATYLGLPPWTPSQRQGLFFAHDLHLNGEGHRFLAEQLLEELRARPDLPIGSTAAARN